MVPVDPMGGGGLERLGAYLKVLAVPNRLQLLRILQVPKTLSEIILAPVRHDRERSPDRPMSRQALERHLGVLEALGLVTSHPSTREGRPVREYMVNHGRLFVLVDELRHLSRIRPVADGHTPTMAHTQAGLRAARSLPAGRGLAVANGPYEGSFFPLDGNGPWTMGRARTAQVSLAHDPFVSKDHALLCIQRGRLVLRPNPATRNPVRVDWRELPRGGQVDLGAGDLIGLGRTLLVVRGV